ncbi:MAG: succinylglutamate desuccinylase/aspartoacylase family protein [Isosphaeraceae bacterium]
MNAPTTFPILTLRGRSDGPHVLIVAGVHGDEFEPISAVRRLAGALEGEVGAGRLTLVPVANLSAFRLGARVGEDGLDLARTCPGRADGSITERVAQELSRLIQSSDALIDLHNGGLRLSVTPLAGYMLHPDFEILNTQRRMARAFGPPIVWGTDPGLEGRTLSVARDAGVPAIYVEYLGGGAFNPIARDALTAGCRSVLADLGITDEAPPPLGSPPLIIEDDRPNSGFMQVQHPCPRDGFFEPRARLGQHVAEGEPLGVLDDPTGQSSLVIRAERSGIVLASRVFPSVLAGESLGVVAALRTRQGVADVVPFRDRSPR